VAGRNVKAGVWPSAKKNSAGQGPFSIPETLRFVNDIIEILMEMNGRGAHCAPLHTGWSRRKLISLQNPSKGLPAAAECDKINRQIGLD
jgi:phenylpropionate dioxygenase-like ring-hydroxylating dioxygenase large terminal subunit